MITLFVDDIIVYVRIYDVFFIAPFEINLSGRGRQQVGSSLILDCTITDMGNNTNSLEIVWITNNMMLQRTIVMPTVIDSLPVYTDSYTISLLTTSDQGRMIHCMANSTNPPVIDGDNIMLNVTGKLYFKLGACTYKCTYVIIPNP